MDLKRVIQKIAVRQDQKRQDQVYLSTISNKIIIKIAIVEIKWDLEILWCNKQHKQQILIIWCQVIEFKMFLIRWQWTQWWVEKKDQPQAKEVFQIINKAIKWTNKINWCRNRAQIRQLTSLKEVICIMYQEISVKRDRAINIK